MAAKRTLLEDRARDALGAAAFDASPWPSLVFDADDRVLMANAAAEMLFGQALASLSRHPFPSLLTPGCELAVLFAQARQEGGTARQVDVEVALLGTPTLEAEVAFSALPDARLLGAFYVESQGARLERASEALRSVAGMGRTLAHEIKNPLAGIRGAAQLLKLGASPADAPLAQVIVDETDRIRRLVDQVEAFSDERVTEKRPVNIHRVLDRVRTLVSSAFGEVAFADAYDPSLPHALGDEDQLVQIFLNVAKNAAEATLERGDGRGEVLVSTGYRSGARIRAGRQGWRNAPLEVRIQDNGPGVAADLRHRLFDAFVTTKTGGMGLGLTLVAKLVDAHGGLIELESEPGRTVFHILLPVAPAPPTQGSSPP
jgi:two-component system, NtrC family, nitrogen regulation sensor histidine kinase GlnL